MTMTPNDLRRRPGPLGTGGDRDPRPEPVRPSRRRTVLLIGLPLLVLALIAAGIWVVGFSSLVAVTTVEVRGADTVPESTVREVAAVPEGVPLARLDVGAVQQRVAGIGELESARVVRDWPHTVRIEVTERTPVYAIPQAGGYLLVDRNGVGYQTVATAGSLPKATVGGTRPELLKAVATVAAALPQSVAKRTTAIEAPTRDAIAIKLKNGDIVFWGSEEQSDLKAKVIVALLKQHGTRYDVSAPGNPAVR